MFYRMENIKHTLCTGKLFFLFIPNPTGTIC